MLSRTLSGGSLTAALLAACRSDRGAPPATAAATPTATTPSAPSVAAFTAAEYRFDGPDSLPAVPTIFRLANHGKELHHLVVVRLDQAHNVASLASALKNPGPPPNWLHVIGGPNAVDPGLESNATTDLTPGDYAVICFIPAKDGMPHFAKGMVRPLRVVPAAGPAPAEPAADVTIRLTDYTFTLSAPLTPGSHVIRVENHGPQTHELVLARFAPGKGLKDFAAWEQGGEKGPPPASALGGISPMDPGNHGSFTVNLEPGDYALLCFVPDAKDRKAHLMHGMAMPVKVG